MKNFKDILLGIFALIGFTSIITAYTSDTTNSGVHSVPESHVWEAIDTKQGVSNESRLYVYNKVTGEVRLYESSNLLKNSQKTRALIYHTGVGLEIGQTGAIFKQEEEEDDKKKKK